MIRINVVLFLVLIGMALGLITSQHKARVLKVQLEKQLKMTSNFEEEYGQLQLEQSTWAMHSRLEEFAQKNLKMSVPDIKRIQVINLDEVSQ